MGYGRDLPCGWRISGGISRGGLFTQAPGKIVFYRDLAAELQQQGKLGEAVAAYKQQAEITPPDKLVHKNLGLFLVQVKRDAEDRAELEIVASSTRGSAGEMALPNLYFVPATQRKAWRSRRACW
jgi:Flp pilus assembly protein TadD